VVSTTRNVNHAWPPRNRRRPAPGRTTGHSDARWKRRIWLCPRSPKICEPRAFSQGIPPSPWVSGIIILRRFCPQNIEGKWLGGIIQKAKDLAGVNLLGPPSKRHPEAPRFLQRGEGSGVECRRTQNRETLRARFLARLNCAELRNDAFGCPLENGLTRRSWVGQVGCCHLALSHQLLAGRCGRLRLNGSRANAG